jgi:hypothetical protein
MSSLAVQIVSKLVGQDNVITIPRAFVEALGSYETSAILSQLIYWHSKMGKEFYKTDEDFCEELCLSVYQLKKARKDLEGFGVNTKRKGVPAKLYYSLDLELLANKLGEILLTGQTKINELEGKKSANYIQETTHKTKTEEKPSSLTTLDNTLPESEVISLLEPSSEWPVNKEKNFVNFQAFLNIWNSFCGSLPKASSLNDKRKAGIKRLVKEHKHDALIRFQEAVQGVAADDWWIKNAYTLDNLLKKGRVTEKAEQYKASPKRSREALRKELERIYDTD